MRDLRAALDGLTPEERRHRVTPHSNHIDFIAWHVARVEDDFIQGFGRGEQSIWRRDGWDAKLGLPSDGNGFGFTAEQVGDLPAFDMDELLAYYDAVRAASHSYIDSLSEADLAVRPNARTPQYSIANMLSHVMVEESQHVGQAAFIRGALRGMGK